MSSDHSSAEQIVTGLSRLATFLRGRRQRDSGARGLTPAQTQILLHLCARGPSRVTALAEELAVTQPTASDAVAALIRKGLAEKRPDATDKRAAAIAPTAAGREQARPLAEWPESLLAAVNDLPCAERAALLRSLTKLIRTLQMRGEIPVQRLCATCRYFRPNVYDSPDAPHHCEFVNAAFGDAALRLDCGEHEPAEDAQAGAAWRRFAKGQAAG